MAQQVLGQLQEELVHYKGTPVSVMELSHRSKDFGNIIDATEKVVRELLGVPDNYRVLLMHGGGTGQFAAVPLNLMSRTGKADYIVTGSWSSKAAQEAAKYGTVNCVLPKSERYTGVPDRSCWKLDPEASYVYYCDNETVEGVEFQSVPDVPEGVPLVCDVSSNYFTRPIDVSKFGLLYGGAQKNIGCAGVTLVIVREDLITNPLPVCPTVLDYTVMAKNKSLYNTPPTFPIHVMGEVLAWVKKEGGVKEMERRSVEKSRMIYSIVDESNGFYSSVVTPSSRSRVNVVFRVGEDGGNEELETKFVDQATQCGLLSLKGHRSVGGIRASLYNAITVDDVHRLAEFMKKFLQENKV
ncbi:probable phosphoserine aminotransferase isoform X2 [Homarus americanus]|uniref:probable phosphoserine aminotransferase isoform X2 n=1 Tax=Homarus americanus TaxID=6706 RepID=UPI001C438F08|nr:probable phosphoserine aminotransferase isoform X2 [Homarus americanus]